MIKILALIGTGSFIGGISRYLFGQFVHRFLPVVFPYGTLAVNITGCFLIGIILGLSDKAAVTPHWRFFLATGFCGGFTTFSSFAYENITLLNDKEYFYMFLYIASSFIIGLAATYIGVIVTKII
jgi:fluoride exporter